MDIAAPDDMARLRWQCRRGMLELDLLLETFVNRQYPELDAQGQAVFRQVLAYPDQLLFDYFFGTRMPMDKDVADVIEKIRCAAAA
jgi:antitoxin CptB